MIIGLAPMDGFTDYAFRQITKETLEKYGDRKKHQLVLRTEFMNANGYLINPVGVVKHLLSNTEQAPLIAQIFGNEKESLVKCFVEVEQKYGSSVECIVQSAEVKMKNTKKNINSKLYTINLPAGRQGSKLSHRQQIFS